MTELKITNEEIAEMLNKATKEASKKKTEIKDTYKSKLPEGFTTNLDKSFEDMSPGQKAREFLNRQPLFFDKGNSWWVWDQKNECYLRVDTKDILIEVRKITGQWEYRSKAKNEFIEVLSQMARANAPKPMPITWVQFNNEVVDIKTGEIHQSTPEYFTTNSLPWKIGETEETPIIHELFKQWVEEEYIQTLYEIIAYCMLSDYPIHRIFCFNGSGRNGKGTFLRIINKFLGEINCTSSDLDRLMKSNFETANLYKKLACFMGETNFNALTKTALLKQISGQDTVVFEFKGHTGIQGINYAKVLIATNSLPISNDNTTGFYSRWLIVDFLNTFSEKKDVFNTIPDYEFENLAKKSIRILKDLLVKREFTNDGNYEERKQRYEDISNPLQKFLRENYELSENFWTWKWEIRKDFDDWAKHNKLRVWNDKEFGSYMKEKFGEDRQKTAPNGKMWRYYDGLKKLLSTISQGSQGSQVVISQEPRKENDLKHPVNVVNPVISAQNNLFDDFLFWFKGSSGNEGVEVELVIKEFFNNDRDKGDKLIEQWRTDGLVFEPKHGFVKVLE